MGKRTKGLANMQHFITTLFICSATMTLFTILYTVTNPLLTKRYSEKSQYYAWLIIVVGLIIPYRPQFNNSLVKVISTETVTPIIQIQNETVFTKSSHTIILHVPETKDIFLSSFPGISIWQIVMVIWLTGMITVLVYHVIKHYRFKKMVRRWSRVISEKHILKIAFKIKAELKITKEIGIYQCESIGSPMLIGFMKPQILLPDMNFTNEELYFILAHELVHYKRKDLWYKVLVLISSAVHWFNPIMYFMARKIDALCEISCDAAVIKNSGIESRLLYSETIMNVVRHQSKLKTALSTNFYGCKKDMKKRISSIIDASKKRVGVLMACVAVLLTFSSGVVMASETAKNVNSTIAHSKSEENAQIFGVPETFTKDSATGQSAGETLYEDGDPEEIMPIEVESKEITKNERKMIKTSDDPMSVNISSTSVDGKKKEEPIKTIRVISDTSHIKDIENVPNATLEDKEEPVEYVADGGLCICEDPDCTLIIPDYVIEGMQQQTKFFIPPQNSYEEALEYGNEMFKLADLAFADMINDGEDPYSYDWSQWPTREMMSDQEYQEYLDKIEKEYEE